MTKGETREYHRRWYRAHRDAILAANKDPKVRARRRKYDKARREANVEDSRRRGREHARKWRQANAKRSREIQIKCLYGLAPEELLALQEKHNGRCAICGLARKLVIDHGHLSGKVRGLLCGRCNTGLGMFYESSEALRKAADYVENSGR